MAKSQIWSGVRILSLLTFLALHPKTAIAVETLIFDLSDTAGSADHPIASGWHGGLRNEVPDSLFLPLRPSYFRGVTSDSTERNWGPLEPQWIRANAMGATVLVELAGSFKLDEWWWDHWNDGDYQTRLGEWITHVHNWVTWAESLRVANGRNVQVQYEVWNEPDDSGFWHPNPAWCDGHPDSVFMQMWHATSDSIRSWHPNAIITGPSLSYVSGAPDSLEKATGLHMDEFLDFCTSNNCLPDVLGWHDLGNSDPKSQDYTGMVDTPDVPRNLYSQVKYISALSSSRVTQYEINEALNWQGQLNLMPGITVREFALAERAKSLGLLFAGRTYWPQDPCETSAGYVQEGRLAGLLQPVPDDSCGLGSKYLGRRYAWWTQKAYVEMSGQFLNISPAANADAVAALSAGGDTLRILTGNYSTVSQALHLVLRGLSAPLVVNGVVNVSIKRIPGTPDSLTLAFDGLAPKYVRSSRYLVYGDSAAVVLAANEFGPGDALSIEVTPIVPDSATAQQDFADIQTSIDNMEPGNTVIVKWPLVGSFHSETLRMRAGVRVVGEPGVMPRITKAGKTLISFPANSNSFTYLEGVQLEGAAAVGNLAATESLVVVRGAGSIRNCTLKDMGQGSVIRGILADEHTGEIRDCTVQMTSHSHVSGQVTTGVVGIDLGGNFEVNNSHVVNCSINVKTGFSPTWGIRTSINASAVIESTLVKGEKHGIQLWNDCIARFCTVDSTYWEGIAGDATARIENCIVSNILHPSVTPGILGSDIQYCICPAGFPFGSSTTNKTEDPLYCGPGEYSLRLDSYGNPENNSSGKQIGAFPVECAWGTLARDVTHSTTPVALKGDLTIPFGRSLVLNDSPVVVDTVDFVHDGQDTSTAELLVRGTLSISAVQSDSVVIQSKSGVRGSWDGITLGLGAKLFLDYVVIRDGKFGLTDNTSLTGDTVRVDHCTFRNFETAGIYLTPLGLYGSDAAPLTISSSYVYMAHAPYGIYLKNSDGPQNNFYNVAITNSHVLNQGASEGIYGIYLYGRGVDSNSEMKVANSEVTQIPYGTGIFVEDLSPNLHWNLIRFCQRGIELYGSGTPSVRGRATAPIGSCGYGLVVGGYSHPVVDSLSINAPYGLASCYGLYGDDYAGGTYSHLSINMNFTSTAPESLHVATAFQAYSQATADSTQKLRSSRLERFYRGVNLSPTSTVNLGGSGQERGNNNIYASAAIAYIGAKSRVAGLPNILARYNFWGADPPPTSMLASWVDYSHWLTSSPLSIGARLPGLEMVALKTMMTASPNPFRESLTIRLQALPLGTQCEVALFDVSGREIRRWSQPVVSSEFQVAWDGRDYLGSSVPPGVYLLRVSAGHERLSTKVVKLVQ